jgi:flagellar basal body L-ring protein FlgH
MKKKDLLKKFVGFAPEERNVYRKPAQSLQSAPEGHNVLDAKSSRITMVEQRHSHGTPTECRILLNTPGYKHSAPPEQRITRFLEESQWIKLLLLLGVFLLSATAVEAQDKKKRKDTQEKTVVVYEPAIPVREQQPANGSLFVSDAPGASLVTDFKARRLGDLIFIEVDETAIATVSSGANRSRDSGGIAGLVGLIAALPSPSSAAVSGVVGGLGSRKFEGQGSTQRQSSLRTTITARVVDVLPNGYLRIEA